MMEQSLFPLFPCFTQEILQMKKWLWLIPGIAVAWSSCQKDDLPYPEERKLDSQQQTACGVYKERTAVMKYDESKYQIAFNTARRSFRLQTDEQEKYVSCVLSAVPALDAELTVSVRRKGLVSLDEGDYVVKVLKVEGGKSWLWNEENLLGFLVRTE